MLTKSLITIAALTLGVSFAHAGVYSSKIDKSNPLLHPRVGCVVKGQPIEFPNDIVIANKGLTGIKAGTTVKWSVPTINANGSYTLRADLAPGKSVPLINALPTGTDPGNTCKASL